MWILLLGAAVVAVVLRAAYHLQSGRCQSSRRLDGKTVVVTGSSAGIGKEAARDFARRGARVIMACRNLEKAQRVADEIVKETGNSDVVVQELDTSHLASVRQFASKLLATQEFLHILVNNAGMAGHPRRETTCDGLEVTMATNYYGHFLLTNLLLKLLKKSAPSRIINVSSVMHKFCSKFDPEDLNFEKKPYNIYSSYNQSKLCNVLFTVELAEKLKNVGVTVNSLHPGAVASEISARGGHIFYHIQNIYFKLFGKDCNLGAQTVIHLAVSEDVENVSGKYFVDCKEAECSKLGRHRGMAQKLWLASELDVKLQPEEVHYG